jgi:D-alanyl-D-alanine carboxypeptidase/D-alanyl-D-alanine carboxypeptidase (penicillin-binding protein 5/6)
MYKKSDYYTHITGIKTGSTSEAGFNLLSSATNDTGMELIAVVMGVPYVGSSEYVFNYSKDLLEYGFENFSMQKVVDADSNIKNISVKNSQDNANLDILTNSDLAAVLPNDKSLWNLVSDVHLNSDISAPINKGDKLGYIEYSNNGVSLGKVDLIASSNIEKASISSYLWGVLRSGPLKRVIIITLSAFLSFLVLRQILRRISRAISAK